MMLFEFTHLIYEDHIRLYKENELPSWLLNKQARWLYDDHVSNLSVGQFILTDFNKIKRIS